MRTWIVNTCIVLSYFSLLLSKRIETLEDFHFIPPPRISQSGLSVPSEHIRAEENSFQQKPTKDIIFLPPPPISESNNHEKSNMKWSNDFDWDLGQTPQYPENPDNHNHITTTNDAIKFDTLKDGEFIPTSSSLYIGNTKLPEDTHAYSSGRRHHDHHGNHHDEHEKSIVNVGDDEATHDRNQRIPPTTVKNVKHSSHFFNNDHTSPSSSHNHGHHYTDDTDDHDDHDDHDNDPVITSKPLEFERTKHHAFQKLSITTVIPNSRTSFNNHDHGAHQMDNENIITGNTNMVVEGESHVPHHNLSTPTVQSQLSDTSSGDIEIEQSTTLTNLPTTESTAISRDKTGQQPFNGISHTSERSNGERTVSICSILLWPTYILTLRLMTLSLFT